VSIKPGNIIEIVFDGLSSREDPLKSLVYDTIAKRLVISQTSPPIPSSYANKTAQVSYIFKTGSEARRFGFSGVITDFSNYCELSSGVRIPTLILDMKTEPKELNLRKGFRVQVSGSSSFLLTIRERSYHIVDISLTGISFVQPLSQNALIPGQMLEMSLTIDRKNFYLNAKVVRVSETVRTRLIAACFTRMGRDLENVLGKRILMIEREQLSRRWSLL
jgi:hypothetical protein